MVDIFLNSEEVGCTICLDGLRETRAKCNVHTIK